MNLIGIGAGLGGLLKGYEQAGQFVQQQQMNQLRMQQAQQAMQQEQQTNQLLDAPGFFSQFTQGGGQMPAIGTGMAGGGVDMSQLPNTSMMGPQTATPPMPAQPSVRRQPAMAPTPMPQMSQQSPSLVAYADPFDPSQGPTTPLKDLPQFGAPERNAGIGTGTDRRNPNAPPPEVTLNPDLMQRFQQRQSGGAPDTVQPSTTAEYIRQGAIQRGLDPNEALRVPPVEGGTGVFKVGDSGTSGGPFQLHVGKREHGGDGIPGLGDAMIEQTGLDPRRPENERAGIDFALDYAKAHGGFSPEIWHGLRGGGGRTGGGEDTLAASAPPQAQRQAQAVAQNSLWNIPPQMYGRMQLQTAAQMIEKAAPNAPGHIKFLALERMQKLLAPDAKLEAAMMMMEMRDRYRRDFREDYPPQGGAGTIVQDKSGNTFLVNPRDPTHPTQIPLEGAQKLGTKGGARSMPAMIMQKYAEEHPNATADELSAFAGRYRREQAIESAFGGGIMGRNMVALNTVADHLSLLTEYADALKNNEIPRANQVLNRFATETGHPEVTNFETARDIAADEVVRLLTTTGGTEADRQGMQARFSAAGSPEQLAGAIEAAGKFVAGRFDALEQQYAGNDQARRQMFENEMITPEARKWYQRSKRPATAPDETQGTKPQEPQAKPGGKQYPTVTSQEQYDALPEGAYFFDGSGNFGQKPKAGQ